MLYEQMEKAAFYAADLRERGDDVVGDEVGAAAVGGEGDEVLRVGG